MKTFKLLPLALFTSAVFAETTSLPDVQQSVTAVENHIVASQTAVNYVVEKATEQANTKNTEVDSVLPQLSLASHQERADARAKQIEQSIEAEVQQNASAEKLQQAESRIKQEIGNNQLQLDSVTAKIYADNNFKAMWTDRRATKTFLKEYAAFAASGVSTRSAKALQQILNAQEGSLVRDILLTDSFLDYLYYNKNVGRNANKWLYRLGSYATKAPSDAFISAWTRAVRIGSESQYMASLVPENHIYKETVNKLFEMSPNGTANSAKKTTKGQKKGTESANTGTSASFAKLALNAQRLRIIPSFDNGIFVNIPSYQLYYFRNGQLTLQSKVSVGRSDRQTPVMYSKLSDVVVNPPWNVPPTIKEKDLVPKFIRNPELVNSANYEILDGRGKPIDPSSINWAQYEGKENTFPYHIRQKPGERAALGRYKFNMPSSDAIYLHDTPNYAQFGKAQRALSSGCVRVDKSADLAALLLKEAGWSDAKRKSVLASKKTTSALIPSDNPVYLYYVTAWVENGKVQTLPDIYKYDTKLPKVSLNWAKVKSVI